MKIIECTQLSPEWWEARRGIPTASEAGRIITPAKWQPSAAQDGYIDELVGDIIRLDPPVLTERGNYAMEHGRETEAEARSWYAVTRDLEPGVLVQAGFVTTDDGRMGCSPDGLMPSLRGGLELKAPQPATHVGYLRAAAGDDGPKLPPEYKPQVHMSLIVTGYDWWDFMSYCRGFPPLLVRVSPDEFTERLRVYLDDFCRRKDEVLNWLRNA